MTSHEHALAALNQRMAELGAANPAAWAGSKVREGIPERARYLALRRIWATALSPWRDRGTLRRYPSLARLLDRGATRTCWPQPAATSSSMWSVTSSWSSTRDTIPALPTTHQDGR